MERDLTRAIELIKQFEGCELSAYKCPAGVWTIGYGSTTFKGRKVYQGQVITLDEAEEQLQLDLKPFAQQIEKAIVVDVSDNQFCALLSFVYNLGIGNFRSSTLLKKLNTGDYRGASLEFPKWNRAGGKVLKGLTRRRLAEQALFNEA